MPCHGMLEMSSLASAYEHSAIFDALPQHICAEESSAPWSSVLHDARRWILSRTWWQDVLDRAFPDFCVASVLVVGENLTLFFLINRNKNTLLVEKCTFV